MPANITEQQNPKNTKKTKTSRNYILLQKRHPLQKTSICNSSSYFKLLTYTKMK